MAGRIYSVKVLGCPSGLERDLVEYLGAQDFKLCAFAINNNPPYDTVLTCNDIQTCTSVSQFVTNNIMVLRGMRVSLTAQEVALPPPMTTFSIPPLITSTSHGPSSFQTPPTISQVLNLNATPASNSHRNSPNHANICKNIRSILACHRRGMDPMRLVNDYKELTSENLFDAIKEVGYPTITDFCNDNLDVIDYEAWNNGTNVIFHGVADAKSAHIFEMNQYTRNKHRPNMHPIPYRVQRSFGNFQKPVNRILEQQQNFSKPLAISDQHRRRIITVVDQFPQGLETEDVKTKYLDLYEETFPLQQLQKLTGLKRLGEILATISTLKLMNNKWVVTDSTPVVRTSEPEELPPIPKDLTKSPEFIELASKIVDTVKSTPTYTLNMATLERAVTIDNRLFGKSSTQELLSLVENIVVREDRDTWVIHHKHKGEELPYIVQLKIYDTLNSEPNGLSLDEFSGTYRRRHGCSLQAEDYNYKSLWHLFYTNQNLCDMTNSRDGLLLLAGEAPPPPVNNTARSRSSSTSPTTTRLSPTTTHLSPTTTRRSASPDSPIFSAPAIFTDTHCCPIGDEERELGYHPFKQDENLIVIFINVLCSPTEFYVTFVKDSPEVAREFLKFKLSMKKVYGNPTLRNKHVLRGTTALGLNKLCVFGDEHNEYHRVIVERTSHTDIVGVRSIDSGKKYNAPTSSIFQLGTEFRAPCFARRCALAGIRPFDSTRGWDTHTDDIFGRNQVDKFFYANFISETEQGVEVNVIDTYTDDDRSVGDILLAEGLAESTAEVQGMVINAPTPSDDSYREDEEVEVEDELKEDWFVNWLTDDVDTSMPALSTTDNTHVDVSDVGDVSNLSLHQPALLERDLIRMSTPELVILKQQRIKQRADLACNFQLSHTQLYAEIDADYNLIDKLLRERDTGVSTPAATSASATSVRNLWDTVPIVESSSGASAFLMSLMKESSERSRGTSLGRGSFR